MPYDVEPAVAAVAREAADALAALGHDVVEATPPWRDESLLWLFARIWQLTPALYPSIDPDLLMPINRALYERLGYSVVGELRDYIVHGQSEWLLRKSKSPIADWTTSNGPLAFGSRRAP